MNGRGILAIGAGLNDMLRKADHLVQIFFCRIKGLHSGALHDLGIHFPHSGADCFNILAVRILDLPFGRQRDLLQIELPYKRLQLIVFFGGFPRYQVICVGFTFLKLHAKISCHLDYVHL